MRRVCLALLLLLVASVIYAPPANAAVNVGISIGIHLPAFPELVVVPGYPVYYAPSVQANYFFYDGYYWVFNIEDGQWYASTWYNGPWVWVEPIYVPQPILVIPYRYYHVRPIYWAGWTFDAPPLWGVHFGRDWEHRRSGWDRWDRSRSVAIAPLPTYQREYPRDRYPAPSQQITIQNQRYTYQVRDTQVQQKREAIVRQQSAGGAKAEVKAQRVEQPESERKRQDAEQQSARGARRETTQPPAAPRQEAPAVERSQPERGRKAEPKRVEPQAPAPREEATPQQAPRRERQERVQPPAAPRQEAPAVERSQPERGPKAEPKRSEPQVAPREQAPQQQAPRGERAPALERSERPEPQQRPDRQPAREERQEQRQDRERGPDRSDEGPGRGKK